MALLRDANDAADRFLVRRRQPLEALKQKHATLLEKARVAGLDPNTILLLLQFFGPLIQALLLKLIDRIGSDTSASIPQ